MKGDGLRGSDSTCWNIRGWVDRWVEGPAVVVGGSGRPTMWLLRV